MVQTDSAVFYKYRMSGRIRVILSVATLLVPYCIVQEVWMIAHKMRPLWALAVQIPLLPAFLGLIAWTTAWSVASADCSAEGMLCTRVIGAKAFIPWGQVRQFKRGILSPVHSIGELRICMLRTDDRIPYCFHLNKDEMARLVSLLRETTNARITGFD